LVLRYSGFLHRGGFRALTQYFVFREEWGTKATNSRRGTVNFASAAQPDVNDWQWALEIYWQCVLQISVQT
jgi:hypothetical protein